ncbi:carboxymuconolactone decarboxylase family protein [Natrarchaeobaculum sulfurireducens]|uniref:Alkylhydroperoxidase family enzyme n=1 Tax=Natrarchaeobaculum sulfurireducens TaxID=2044521 RepID=A0A346PAE8_9EURY|nr:carboxymuconolactone decarboxylase family protein [Natrarchaeobaculum sulfurireducens]AXR76493.1 Alkylhydroperoxidase family enzyme [Natrarchaeobaculum sulfurireducens]
MARIDYANPEGLPAEKRDLLDTLSDADVDDDERSHSLEGGTLNVYRTLGRTVALLEGFRGYGSTVWLESGLSPHERETVILATAYYADTAYEWHQHVRVALDEGMDPEEILAISREEPDRLEPERAALVAYVERFVDDEVDDETHERLADHYDEETILGVCALSGCYLGLARLLQALEVDLENEFVGWDLENL